MLRFIQYLVVSVTCTWLNMAYADVHIRSLAGSCAACHGTNGNSVAGMAMLAGIDAKYFSTQMLAFKTGARTATVMHRHAVGLTENEIEALAQYFSSQMIKPSAVLRPVKLQ